MHVLTGCLLEVSNPSLHLPCGNGAVPRTPHGALREVSSLVPRMRGIIPAQPYLRTPHARTCAADVSAAPARLRHPPGYLRYPPAASLAMPAPSPLLPVPPTPRPTNAPCPTDTCHNNRAAPHADPAAGTPPPRVAPHVHVRRRGAAGARVAHPLRGPADCTSLLLLWRRRPTKLQLTWRRALVALVALFARSIAAQLPALQACSSRLLHLKHEGCHPQPKVEKQVHLHSGS